MTPEERDAHFRSGEDVGGGHFIFRTYVTPDGERCVSLPAGEDPPKDSTFIGITDHHRRPDGTWCGGYIRFANVVHDEARWGAAHHELLTDYPLTIAPSLGCRNCPSHGWIRSGRWKDTP